MAWMNLVRAALGVFLLAGATVASAADYPAPKVPMASLPTPMSGRNWMLRRLRVETIKLDPAWNNGNYTQQPASLRLASVFFATATSGGNHSYFKAGPTRERNPVELGVLDREIERVRHGRALPIPASEQTLGHGTTGQARLYKNELGELLRTAPRVD